MNLTLLRKRTTLLAIARLLCILLISLIIATVINRDTYTDYYSKRLFRLHTSDLKALADQMTIKLNFFLSQNNREGVQNVLDASFGLFGFLVTDCLTADQLCPEQKIIYTSDLSLPWVHNPLYADLHSSSFAILRRLPEPANSFRSSTGRAGEIIGRLYVVSNIPNSFTSDFREFLRSPLIDAGARRFYLRTICSFVAGALLIWFFSEMYLRMRRKQQQVLMRREFELKQSVNRQMKELAEKDAQISRLNEQTRRQYEDYVKKIRSLNLKIQDEEEYRELAEQIITDLEADKQAESERYNEILTAVRSDMERLQAKVELFEKTSKVKHESSFKALEEAVRVPNFSNVFEQRIFETVSASEHYKSGSWRTLSNYDVAPGRNYRQFTDFIVFNKDALIILEAKYYVGLIDSPGDFLNDIWFSTGTQKKRIESLWGENPYHQLNEYSMSLMKILKQKSPWSFQIFGIIIFPDDADISKIGDHLGKFYRIVKLSSLVSTLDAIFAEAGRYQAAKNPKRPKSSLLVEDMLRGRKVSL